MNNKKNQEFNNGDLGLFISNSIIDRFMNIKTVFTKYKNDPNSVLESFPFEYIDDYIFFKENISKMFEDNLDVVLEFYNSIINKSIEKINNKLLVNDINLINKFDYDFNSPVIVVEVNSQGYKYTVAKIDPLYGFIQMQDLKKNMFRLSELEAQIDEVNRGLEIEYEIANELALASQNIIYMAGDNALKMIDMKIRKNKYKNELDEKLKRNNLAIKNLNQKKGELSAKLDDATANCNQLEFLTNNYINKLIALFNFSVL